MDIIPQGYQKTEIGVIPEDWRVNSLGEIGDVKMCRRIFSYETREFGDVPFYKIGTFGKEPDAYISKEQYQKYKQLYDFPVRGDILISASGTIGRTVVYDGKDAYFQDSNIVWIDNDERLVTNSFLNHMFKRVKYDTEGGTIQRLYNSILKAAKIPLPSIPEQTQISKTLTDIDTFITSLEKLIDKKKIIRQGVMQELLTGKRRLPGFNGDWRKVTLGNIAKFGKGKGLAKKDILSSGKKECIHYGELFTIYGTHIKNIHCKTNLDGDVYLSLDNDVLMPTSDVTPTGLAKASCIRKNGVILGGGILVIRLINGFDGEFLSMKIRQDKNQILQLVTGTTVFHIYERDMNQFEFSTPEYDEQVAIVHTINDMNEEVDRLTEKLFKLKQIKQGAMQQLLTGKIRLINK